MASQLARSDDIEFRVIPAETTDHYYYSWEVYSKKENRVIANVHMSTQGGLVHIFEIDKVIQVKGWDDVFELFQSLDRN